MKIKGAIIAAIIGFGFVFFLRSARDQSRAQGGLFLGISSRDSGDRKEVMKCERCLSLYGEIAEYRLRTDVMDIKVCGKCADEARAIGGLVATPLNELAARGGTDSRVAA